MFRVIGAVALAATLGLLGVVAEWRGSVRNRTIASAALGAWDAESWHHLQRTYPTGRLPPGDALARAAAALQGVSGRPVFGRRPGLAPRLSLPGEEWIAIGPQPIFTQTHPFAGRVTAVAPHPTVSTTIYLGADNGGIWRTTDDGLSWTPLTDGIPVPAVQSLAIDPVDPRLIYATTIQRTYGTRWLRSTDGGDTWAVGSVALEDGRALEPARCAINVFKACIPPSSGRIVIDPSRAGSQAGSTIYVAGLSHLLRSDDSGGTFRPVLALDTDLDFAPGAANLHPEAEFIRDVAIDPARPERLLVAVAQPRCTVADCTLMDSTVSVYRTDDAGESWMREPVAAIGEYPLDNTRYADPGAVYVPRVRVAISPINPDMAAVAIRDIGVNRPRVVLSTDAGRTWIEVTPASTTITWPLDLAFSPTDAATMYVASASVYRTTNAGLTWQALASTHVDNIDLAFDAAGVLITGNDGGIFRQTTGTAFAPLHRALPITEFYSVAAHPTNPFLIAGGTQDNGTVLFQGAQGWSMIVGGDGGDTIFDPNPSARVLYGEIEWFFIGNRNVFLFFRCEPGGCLNRSEGIDLSLAGPFIPKMAMDPASSSTIWLTAERMFRTDDRADSWTAASPSVRDLERCWDDPEDGRTCAAARYFTAVAVAPTATATVYGGTLNGDVRVTNDRGATWRSLAGVEAGPLPVRAVNDVLVDPIDANTVYIAYSGFDAQGSGAGHVFRTTNGGQTWQDLSGNLPDVPVNALLLDPDSTAAGAARVLYVGTDVGVFRATVGDTPAWTPFGAGMPPVIVNDLTYNAATRQLLAATYGRGLYAISSRFMR